jgi:hypothetical protein
MIRSSSEPITGKKSRTTSIGDKIDEQTCEGRFSAPWRGLVSQEGAHQADEIRNETEGRTGKLPRRTMEPERDHHQEPSDGQPGDRHQQSPQDIDHRMVARSNGFSAGAGQAVIQIGDRPSAALFARLG